MSINFVDKTTVITSEWLNDVDNMTYSVLSGPARDSGGDLTITSTTHIVKGKIIVGTSFFEIDEANGQVNIDNLRVDGNTISSTSGGVTITPLAGQVITLDTNVTIDGGAVDITGDLDVDNLNLNGNTIISTDTDGDINLTPNGTGSVVISLLSTPSTVEVTNLNAQIHGGLKIKVIDIGDWDMDATANVSIAHGITYSNIRTISVTIRDDADTAKYPMGSGANPIAGWTTIGSTNVAINRVTSGIYDNVSFNSTGYNRGWITIWYV